MACAEQDELKQGGLPEVKKEDHSQKNKITQYFSKYTVPKARCPLDVIDGNIKVEHATDQGYQQFTNDELDICGSQTVVPDSEEDAPDPIVQPKSKKRKQFVSPSTSSSEEGTPLLRRHRLAVVDPLMMHAARNGARVFDRSEEEPTIPHHPCIVDLTHEPDDGEPAMIEFEKIRSKQLLFQKVEDRKSSIVSLLEQREKISSSIVGVYADIEADYKEAILKLGEMFSKNAIVPENIGLKNTRVEMDFEGDKGRNRGINIQKTNAYRDIEDQPKHGFPRKESTVFLDKPGNLNDRVAIGIAPPSFSLFLEDGCPHVDGLADDTLQVTVGECSDPGLLNPMGMKTSVMPTMKNLSNNSVGTNEAAGISEICLVKVQQFAPPHPCVSGPIKLGSGHSTPVTRSIRSETDIVNCDGISPSLQQDFLIMAKELEEDEKLESLRKGKMVVEETREEVTRCELPGNRSSYGFPGDSNGVRNEALADSEYVDQQPMNLPVNEPTTRPDVDRSKIPRIQFVSNSHRRHTRFLKDKITMTKADWDAIHFIFCPLPEMASVILARFGNVFVRRCYFQTLASDTPLHTSVVEFAMAYENARNTAHCCDLKHRTMHYFSPWFSRDIWALDAPPDDQTAVQTMRNWIHSSDTPRVILGMFVFPHCIRGAWAVHVVNMKYEEIVCFQSSTAINARSRAQQFGRKLVSRLCHVMKEKWPEVDLKSYTFRDALCHKSTNRNETGFLMMKIIENLSIMNQELVDPVTYDARL